jgi:hypothetical protein
MQKVKVLWSPRRKAIFVLGIVVFVSGFFPNQDCFRPIGALIVVAGLWPFIKSFLDELAYGPSDG